MSDHVIRASGIGKQYVLGRNTTGSIREAISGAARSLFRRREPLESFWALRDVGFEVKRGEIVGIIGRNGAGKSTLLKVLSRITEPTVGRVDVYGRLASLLEVGTGFHPELSGRENVFLNGAILGMSRHEIRRKFDEIVAFAEVEKFIDTPVKRYSSGMYLRLAFSVAAHLEPEILVVDEVLAVGDASFQRKCLDKMEDVGHHGRTVLFVSHNMAAVTRLCSRTILLHEGRVLQDGPSPRVVSSYLTSGMGTRAHRSWVGDSRAPGNEWARLRDVRVLQGTDVEPTDCIDIRNPVGVSMEYEVLREGKVLVPNFHFLNEEGACVFVSLDHESDIERRIRPPGIYRSTAWIPGNLLAEGTLIVGAAMSTMDPVEVHFYERDAVAFQVVDSGEAGSARGRYAGQVPGYVHPKLEWKTENVGTPALREAI